MTNKERRNKNEKRGRFSCLCFLLLSLLIFSCPSPFDKQSSFGELPEGFGSFSLRVESARTILPTVTTNDFAVYMLSFLANPGSGGTSQNVDRTNANLSDPVTLAVGTYSLAVSAYRDAGKTRLAAQGTELNIVISSGTNVTRSLTLKPLGTGSGTFSWNITMSATGVSSASMAITPTLSGSPVNLLTPGASTGSLTLNSGKYNVRFTLTKEGAQAVWDELLYVYDELTSNFTFTFNDNFFYETRYTVTLVYNNGDADGAQSVTHGGTLTKPADPEKTDYRFGGWYTDSGLTNSSYDFNAKVYKDFTLYAKWIDNSPENPFLVTNETELRYVGKGSENPPAYQNWTLDKHYRQTANITLPPPASGQSNWTIIGSIVAYFTGSYNGGGYTITGLTLTGANYIGMFCAIGTGGTVENLGLIDVNITGTGNSMRGGIAGENRGGTIQNCYVSGSVTGSNTIGGITGQNASGGTIQNCYVIGSVTSNSNNVGGIVGSGVVSTIQNCVALNESVSLTNGGGANIGRVKEQASGTLQNNYGWKGMTLTIAGTSQTPMSDPTGRDGADITAAEAKTKTAWETAGFVFDANSPWVWSNAHSRPVLRNEVPQAWPGYLVDPPPPIEMVFVPGGSFQMGNPDTSGGIVTDAERPVHTVTLTSGFYMGKHEVTQAQWQAVMGTTIVEQQAAANGGSTNYGRSNDHPIYYVNWYEALVFCNKLSMAEGLTPAYRIDNSTDPSAWGSVPTASSSPNRGAWDNATIVSGSTGYRLPTEAQWEYAAKGGDGSPGNYTYAGSNNADEVAWYYNNNGDFGSSTYGSKAVGTKEPNGLGLYDMSGNVYEWCWDWYGSYSSEAQTDPMGASSASQRVARSPCWENFDVRSTLRSYRFASERVNNMGFRLVLPAQ